jgi:hypothetical protein
MSTPRRTARPPRSSTKIVTAKLNDVDPRSWLADALTRVSDHPAAHLHELLPWNWRTAALKAAA